MSDEMGTTTTVPTESESQLAGSEQVMNADLIALLEATKEPDREIDARIAYAALPALQRTYALDEWLRSKHAAYVRNYTWSVDDALTLVPDGWDYCLTAGKGEDAHASLGPAEQVSEVYGNAPFLAIALCIAALKARARIVAINAIYPEGRTP